MKLIVTVDTECDMPGWQVQPTPTVKNIRALPRLQEICDRHGVAPTYLVTHPVATQPESVSVLKELRDHSEIGTHLHPWTCPPFDGEDTTRVSYQKDYTPERQREKLEVLTRAIQDNFSVQPTSHRAGRFGVDGVGLTILQEMGYLVDSSVAPLTDLRADGGPDYRDAPHVTYRPSANDITRAGELGILQVPVSVSLTRKMPALLRKCYVRLPGALKIRGLLSKDYLGFLDLFWLYPTQYEVDEMTRAARTLRRLNAEAWVVFLHSSELEPGMSPYTHTPEEVDTVLGRIDDFLGWALSEGGAEGCTLSDFARSWSNEH